MHAAPVGEAAGRAHAPDLMNLFARLFRLIWGGNVDRALRPVLAVSLAGSIAGSTAYPYLGIWAIKHLDAPQGTLAFVVPRGRRPARGDRLRRAVTGRTGSAGAR